MRHKVILVLVDGLSARVAHGMGYLAALVAAGQGSHHRLACELPSLSRPLYECLLTGANPVQSGITHNGVSRLSTQTSLFHLATRQGRRTAAAAYHWVSELYNVSPWQVHHRVTDDEGLPIQHGLFYWDDGYPDSHLLADAEALRARHDPDFLLVHPMGVDDAGHRFGLGSPEYRNSARRMDVLLAAVLPHWLAAGYQVVVTADHGMNEDGSHGGTLDDERQVPLWLLGEAFDHGATAQAIPQTALCGLLADLMGLEHDKVSLPWLLAREGV
ncbi:alkaline phosphatase family protein [Aeromonas schubertii]|nr:alkaline phosphatase family protein [Aeromonas schubertii]